MVMMMMMLLLLMMMMMMLLLLMMMMTSISSFGPVGCGRPVGIRGTKRQSGIMCGVWCTGYWAVLPLGPKIAGPTNRLPKAGRPWNFPNDIHVQRVDLHVRRVDLHVKRVDSHIKRVDSRVERVDSHNKTVDSRVNGVD
jgi:hypothetical protein